MIIYKATSDPDTMYMHKAMKDPDSVEFRKVTKKEWEYQLENGNFTVMRASEITHDDTVLPAVWQMIMKRDIHTRKINK